MRMASGVIAAMTMIVMMIVLVLMIVVLCRNCGSMSRMRSRSKALRPSTSARSILARSVLCKRA